MSHLTGRDAEYPAEGAACHTRLVDLPCDRLALVLHWCKTTLQILHEEQYRVAGVEPTPTKGGAFVSIEQQHLCFCYTNK